MPITVLFFGALTEHTKTDRLQLFDKAGTFSDVASLRSHVELLYPGLTAASYRTALNLTFADEADSVKDGDEVAFLPPYAGG